MSLALGSLREYFTTIDPESNKNSWHYLIMNAGFAFDRAAMTTKYTELYETKQGHLLDLQKQYGPLPE